MAAFGSFQKKQLVLASKSLVRAHLLRQCGLVFQTCEANIDERALEARFPENKPAGELACALAEAKALDVSRRWGDAIVIGADQMLECEGARLHKVKSYKALRQKLLWLSGKTHTLSAAVVVTSQGVAIWRHVEEAHLQMRELSSSFIDRYIDAAGDEVLQSVGGYQLEGPGVQLFEGVKGDYFTILGLPLLPLLACLRQQEALLS